MIVLGFFIAWALTALVAVAPLVVFFSFAVVPAVVGSPLLVNRYLVMLYREMVHRLDVARKKSVHRQLLIEDEQYQAKFEVGIACAKFASLLFPPLHAPMTTSNSDPYFKTNPAPVQGGRGGVVRAGFSRR